MTARVVLCPTHTCACKHGQPTQNSEALQWTGGHSFYSHAHILSSACELAFPPYVVVLNTERLNCSGIIDWPHLWLH